MNGADRHARAAVDPVRIADDWRRGAAALAEWARRRMANRADAYGRYKPLDRRRDAKDTAFTAKAELTPDVLTRHFRGRDVGHLVGLHSTSPSNTSLWLAFDVDRHGDGGDPEANRRFAANLYAELVVMGFRPLLLTSNGRGGYHLIVFFDAPIPTATAHAFGRWLIRCWKDAGLAGPPETFPKQAAITAADFGNWLRLFGRHHTLDHWSQVWDGRGGWLDGERAILAILDVEGDPESLIPDDARRVGAAL
jgi:hypothetical protein